MSHNNNYQILTINNIKIHIINSKKFKTTCFSFRLSTFITREINYIISALSYFLLSNTSYCKNKKDINRHLEKMFGAKVYASNTNFGDLSVLNFVLKTIDKKYTGEQDFFENSIDFLLDVIFGKYEKKNNFEPVLMDEEKESIIENIKLLRENKQDYAFNLLLNKMFKNENLSVFTFDKIKSIKELTLDNIEKIYHFLIENSNMDLIISGDFENTDKIIEILEKKLPNYIKKKNDLKVDLENSIKIIKKEKYIDKVEECNQAHIFIGYRTNILYDSKKYFAQFLSNAILGGFMNSRLFQIVREKYNLCYSVYSFLRPLDKSLFIYAGVDNNKIDETLKIIKEIMEELKMKKISDSELTLFKDSLINSLKEADDNQYNQMERSFSCVYTNKKFDIKDTITKLNEITNQDVLEYFNEIKADTTFVLRGKNNDEKS